MRDDVKDAVLNCVKFAVTKGTQSGRHIAPLTAKIAQDMKLVGYDEDSIFLDDVNVTLPGWFRPSKRWDITAFEGGVLVAAIELKSINGSFGKNANNRVEEALGSASDVEYATHNHLLEPNDLPPNFGYALLIRKTPESTRPSRIGAKSRYAFDKEFENTSYVDRFTILGKRLLRERIYQAVWVAVVDLENEVVEEPDPLMTYDKFIAHLKGWIDVVRA
ncbi:MAG: hypothetical protein IKG21_06825 [Atopobiaceae bacterium]|nr:hypothetical protein [Atopobiaceae bacterium]